MNDTFLSFSKEARLNDLSNATQFCTLCARMEHRDKILSTANGNTDSKVLFIAEAPGRLGADKTGIPLYGDKTGNNFEVLLSTIGWVRNSVFITNALLCNPRKSNGTNCTPKLKEVKQCSSYLEMTINLVNPEVIVTLGRIALEAISFIKPHKYNLSEVVAQPFKWANRILFPLYHPGPRAMVHRSFAKQTADFIALDKYIDPIRGIKSDTNIYRRKKIKKEYHTNFLGIHLVVNAILESVADLSYFKIGKLLYLIDNIAIKKLGHTLTDQVYLRLQEGPWIPKIWEHLKKMDGNEIELYQRRGKPFIRQGHKPRLLPELGDKEREIIAEIVYKYGNMTDSEIKTVVYMSKPMRYILRQERMGKKMRNAVVLYKDKTILEEKLDLILGNKIVPAMKKNMHKNYK